VTVDYPPIAVITPTWQRHELLLTRCLPSVLPQLRSDEDVVFVVSDGPDPALTERIDALERPEIVYRELPEHPSGLNTGSAARRLALDLLAAAAEAADQELLIAYLDDDNAYRPEHLSTLGAELHANPDLHFVYSQMFRHGLGDVIGSAPAAFGTIDTSIIMHRVETLAWFGTWTLPEPYPCDWDLVNKWVTGGARYRHIPTITVDYFHQGAK
jgi:glycosyltransferase involved in cell wall biosynthesis